MNNTIFLIMLSASFILHGMEHSLSQSDRKEIKKNIKNSSLENCYCTKNNFEIDERHHKIKQAEHYMFESLNNENKEKYLHWAANKISRTTQWESHYRSYIVHQYFFWKSVRQYRHDTIFCSTQDNDNVLRLNQRTNIAVTEPCLDKKRVAWSCLSAISLVVLASAVYHRWLR